MSGCGPSSSRPQEGGSLDDRRGLPVWECQAVYDPYFRNVNSCYTDAVDLVKIILSQLPEEIFQRITTGVLLKYLRPEI